MSPTIEICSICAWRETCQKKFSISGRDARCPDFAEDISLKKQEEQETEEEA